MLQNFSVAISVSPHVCFILVSILISMFLRYCIYELAGRPKAALLFWFFGDFRCGALLFMVIHVIYKYKNK